MGGRGFDQSAPLGRFRRALRLNAVSLTKNRSDIEDYDNREQSTVSPLLSIFYISEEKFNIRWRGSRYDFYPFLRLLLKFEIDVLGF